jgi:hypothetical protein
MYIIYEAFVWDFGVSARRNGLQMIPGLTICLGNNKKLSVQLILVGRMPPRLRANHIS